MTPATPIISIFGTPADEERYLNRRFNELGLEATVSYSREPLRSGRHLADSPANAISVFIDSRVDATVMDHFPNLSFITTRSTGFDHIDLAEAARRGITVSNVPSYGERTVAEFTFALILTLSRKILTSAGHSEMPSDTATTDLRGFDLCGKTLGIIGTGRIGRHVTEIARGFGLKIVAFDMFPRNELAQELGFSYVSLDQLLAACDIVSIHVPLTDQTRHLIDALALAKMKKGSVLINTSRGGLVDTSALADALSKEHIAGAGLDVLEDENISSSQSLLKMPNVIITPHNAYNTKEALERILDTTVDNIKAWKEGRVINAVSTMI